MPLNKSLPSWVTGEVFAVHHPIIHHHLAAVGLPDALVPEADAHDRQFAGEVLDDIDRQAGLARGAGAGGDEDALWFVGFDLLKGDLVVPMHGTSAFNSPKYWTRLNVNES